MRLSALAISVALVTALTTSAWGAPGDPEPVPVRTTPRILEHTPTSHGAWLGWAQTSPDDVDHGSYFVQRGTQAPIRVNAPRTDADSAGVAGRHVYYVQQSRDYRDRLIRFDLETGKRTPLPAKVNHRRHREYPPCCGGSTDDHKDRMVSGVSGNVTASGPWLLYSGYMADLDLDFGYNTAMLYNRSTHRLRTLATMPYDEGDLLAGQVNGRYATYWSYGRYGGEELYRYDIETKRSDRLPLTAEDVWDPAVSADGTVYYVRAPDSPYTYELVRQPVDAPAEVVTTLSTPTQADSPAELFVRDRPNGSRVVFFSWHSDLYEIVDASTVSQPPGA